MALQVPREYQEIGIEFLKTHKRAILADNAGLGKTLQAMKAAKLPVLIACPTYLMKQWKDYIKSQFPSFKIAFCTGTRAQRQAQLDAITDFTIINIEMFRNYEIKRRYSTLIIDESHRVRGRLSQQAKNAREVSKHIENVYLLTATPIQNTADDLYMQLSIIDSKKFHSYSRFVSDYCTSIQTPWGMKVLGVSNPEKLKEDLKPYFLRRTYQDAKHALPDLIEQVVTITPSYSWRNNYQKLKQNYGIQDITFDNAMQVFVMLRQVCLSDEKLEACKNLLEDIDGSGAVVFTWYKNSAWRVGEYLDIPVITGEIPATSRVEIAKKNPKIVANIASLSEGVDLSDKNVIIFIEESYIPGEMYQAISRVRRARENPEPVRVYYIHLEKTLDEIVFSAREDKNETVISLLRKEYQSG